MYSMYDMYISQSVTSQWLNWDQDGKQDKQNSERKRNAKPEPCLRIGQRKKKKKGKQLINAL